VSVACSPDCPSCREQIRKLKIQVAILNLERFLDWIEEDPNHRFDVDESLMQRLRCLIGVL